MNFKLFTIVLLLFLTVNAALSQTDTTITSLEGFIDNEGNTQILYSTKYKTVNLDADSTYYTYELYEAESNSNSKLLEGHEIKYYPELFVSSEQIDDIEFFNNDPKKYIYSINSVGIDPDCRISRYDSVDVFGGLGGAIEDIYILPNDTSIVYAIFSNYLIKSEDAGFSWEESHQLNEGGPYISHLTFSKYDESTLFGYDSNNNLFKSVDTGKTYTQVYGGRFWDESSKIYFDRDREHIYAASNRHVFVDSYQHYFDGFLLKSNQRGNINTWEELKIEDNYISLCIDDSMSGELFYSKGMKIFKSTDFGDNFEEYIELPHHPQYIYRVPNQNIIFATMPDGILKIVDQNFEYVIKKPITNSLKLYPLAVGNQWSYSVGGVSYDVEPHPFDYTFTETITKDSIFGNGKRYYFIDGEQGRWVRIDSLTGDLIQKGQSDIEDEFVLNLLSQKGDEYFGDDAYYYGFFEGDTILWGSKRYSKSYYGVFMGKQDREFAEGIGLISSYNEFDFGYSYTRLEACLIDGVVYEDSSQQFDFFPLQIGNRWQYSEYDVVVLESMAIGDTTMLNSKTYTKISGVSSGYYRKEGSKVYLYNTTTDEEDLKYDFSLKEGDTLSVEAYDQDTLVIWVSSIGYTEIFGESRKYFTYMYEWVNASGNYERRFIDGIGFSNLYGFLSYWLNGAVIDGKRYGTIVGVDKSRETVPTKFSLQQNFPNPFNPSTTLSYSIPEQGQVELKIYDVLGREVATLVNKEQQAGSYAVNFDASRLTSGIYFYRLQSSGFVESMKMLLVK